jgi:hypothetical protein
MKKINYRGGLISFDIPDSWKEEYNSEGGIFYEDSPNSGTLRVHVLTLKKKGAISAQDEIKRIESLHKSNNAKMTITNENDIFLSYKKEEMDDNTPIIIFFWEKYQILQPNIFRIAMFSYTFPKLNNKISPEVTMLEESIKSAEFTNRYPEI